VSQLVSRVLVLLCVATALSACVSRPDKSAELDAPVSNQCLDFLNRLPKELADLPRVDATADRVLYGDPAVVIWCAAPAPSEFSRSASCIRANNVDWFAPEKQYLDQSLDVVLTTVYRTPRISVQLPADYRPEGIAAALSDLAPTVIQTTTASGRCGQTAQSARPSPNKSGQG
jgi:hypothetical protein